MSKTTVLGYSGGLDSTVLLYQLLDAANKVYPVFFHYGSKHNDKEYDAAKRICSRLDLILKTVDLSFMSDLVDSALLRGGEDLPQSRPGAFDQRSTVVPGRNTVFASVLIAYAESVGADRIALANHADDHATFPDTRPEWIAALRLLAFHGTVRRVELYTPFTELPKREVIILGQKLGVPFSASWTCYAGKKVSCGLCAACQGRRESFLSAGLIDPLPYLV